MKPGPRPLPSALRAIGARSHHARNRAEPQAPIATGRLPRWPKLPEDAARVWRRLAPELVTARVLTRLDEIALAIVCTAVADYLRDPTGRKLRAALAGLAEFGASPSSRTRIHAVAVSEPDALEAFLAGRRPGGAA